MVWFKSKRISIWILLACLALPFMGTRTAHAIKPKQPTITSPILDSAHVDTVDFAATTTDQDGDNWFATFEVHVSNTYADPTPRTIIGTTVPSGSSSVASWNVDRNAGTYYVRVKATDTTGSDSLYRQLGAITVNRSPATALVSPAGNSWFTTVTPTLSWSFSDLDTGHTQTAYQLYVKDSLGTTIYDSGQVSSGSSSNVLPAGILTESTGSYSWSVKAWDNLGAPSLYAAEGQFRVDTTWPTGSVVINALAASTNSANVNLALLANDATAGVSQMRFSNDNASWSAWEAFAASRNYTLPGGDGNKTLYVQFRDAALNQSATYSDAILLDTTLPAATASPLSAYQTVNPFTLNWTGSDGAGSGIASMKLYYSTDNGSTWNLYGSFTNPSISFTAGSNGEYHFAVRALDNAGNEEAAPSGPGSIESSTTVDTVAPTGSITIAGNASYTNTTAVALSLAASDLTTLVTDMQFSADNVTWTGWEVFGPTKSYTLTAGDGLKTVYVQFKDSAGNISATYSDSITLDMTMPVGTASPLTAYKTVSTFPISWTVVDTGSGPLSVKLYYSTDGGATWNQFGTTYGSSPTSFTAPGDGPYAFSIRALDNASNEEALPTGPGDIETSTTVDTSNPDGSIVINGASDSTNAAAVTLTLSHLNASQMHFSDDNTAWTSWEPYAISKPYTLPAGDGTKTVYVQYINGVGSTTTAVSDSILLDTVSPSATASGLAAYQTSSSFNVTWSGSDGLGSGVANVKLYSSTDSGTTWTQYGTTFTASSIAFTAAADTTYYFSVRALDYAGNEETAPSGAGSIEATTVVDTIAPSGSISIDGGASYTVNTEVTLDLTETDEGSGTSQMRLSNDNVTWSVWEPYATPIPFTLTAGDGNKSVYLQLKDLAGNVSASINDSILLDTTNPSGTASTRGAYETALTFPVDWTAGDSGGSGVASVKLYYSTDGGATWNPFGLSYGSSPISFVAAGDGTYSFSVQALDNVGNEELAPIGPGSVEASTFVDTQPPSGTILINGGDAFTNLTTLSLELTANDIGSGISEMRFSDDNTIWSAWEPFDVVKSYTITSGDGLKSVYLQVSDLAGNVSATASDSITMDATPPVATASPLSPYQSILTFNVNWTADDGAGTGVDTVKLYYTTDGGVTWTQFGTTYAASPITFTAPGDGQYGFNVRGTDSIGNEETAPSGAASIEANTTVDTLAPTGSIVINANAFATNMTAVSLTLNGLDSGTGVEQMRFSDDGITWSVWQAYQSNWPYTLQNGEGNRTVYVEFMDAVGNTSATLNDAILLDITPPTAEASVLDTYQPSLTFDLPWTGTDGSGSGVARVKLYYSTDDGLNWVQFGSTFTGTPISFTAPADGPYAFSMVAVDVAGNEESAPSGSGSIESSTTVETVQPTGTILINNDDPFTSAEATTLTLFASNTGTAVTEMRFSVDGTTWSIWEAYATSRPYILFPGDGLKSVYVQYKSLAGTVSMAVSDSITLDTTAPTGAIEALDPFTGSTTFDLNWTADDGSGSGVASVTLYHTTDNGATWALFGPPIASSPIAFTAESDGTYGFYIQATDELGNEAPQPTNAGQIQTSTTIDLIGPEGSLLINGGDETTVDPTVELAITANDIGSGVSEMRFSDDSLTWTEWELFATERSYTVPDGDGTKFIYIQFRDAVGNEGPVSSAFILLDTSDLGTESPTVSITSPATGDKVAGAVTVTASATDDRLVTKVEFFLDGLLVATDRSEPFEWVWDTTQQPNGGRVLTAKAYDVPGNVVLSDPAVVLADNPIPSLVVTDASREGDHLRGTVVVDGSGLSGAGVTQIEFYIDDLLKGTATVAPYTWSWVTTTMSNGAHRVTAKSYNADGLVDSSELNITVDNSLPSVTITSPKPGITVKGSATFTATAKDNASLAQVDFHLDGKIVATDSSAPFSVQVDTTTFTNGLHTLIVKAYDRAGNVALASYAIGVWVDNQPPVVTLTVPADGETVYGTVMITTGATDNRALAKVEFYLDDKLLGSRTGRPYSYKWDTNKSTTGTHTLSAKAIDKVGNSAESATITVNLDKLPTVAITNAKDLAFVHESVTVKATAADDLGVTKVEFLVDKVLKSTATVAPFEWVWDSTAYPNGVRVLTALAYDTAGNSSAVTIRSYVDNQPPTVTISAPKENDSVRGITPVRVATRDNRGVTKVEFRLNGAIAFTDTRAPYLWSLNTTSLPNGSSHLLSATAYDAAGNSTTSADRTVLVDNEVPIVTLSGAAAGATVLTAIPITATATDNIGIVKVEFLLNRSVRKRLTAAPYTWEFNPASLRNGNQTIQAKAYDAAGNVTIATLVLFVDKPPTVKLTAPLRGQHLKGQQTVKVDARDLVGLSSVELYLDGLLHHTWAEAPYQYQWETTESTNGVHTLLTKAYDIAGNATISLPITVTVDNENPSLTIPDLVPGALIGGTTMIKADVTDNALVAKVEFMLDSKLIFRDTGRPYSWRWNTATAASGAHTLEMVAYDKAGNLTSSGVIPVTVDQSPKVTLIPPNSAKTVGGTVNIEATASDDLGVSKVEFYLGDSLQASVTEEPYNWSWNTTLLTDGWHRITAKAYDTVGQATATLPLVIFVDNQAPVVSVRAPTEGAVVRGNTSITLTMSDNRQVVQVEFFVDGTRVFVDTRAPFTWKWNTATVSDGSTHTIEAKAYDAAGNSTLSAPRSLTVDNEVPTISISSPDPDTAISGTVTVQVDVADNMEVARVDYYVDGRLRKKVESDPFSWELATTSLTVGTHKIMAIAFDSAGNAASSTYVTATVVR